MKRCLFIAAILILALGVCACSSPAQESAQQPAPDPTATLAPTPEATPEPAPEPEPEPETSGIRIAKAVQTGSGVTVKTASDWASEYADIYASYMKNSENSAQIDHVEEFPMIAKLYEGMAFSKYYNSARGHTYSVEDLTSTGRPHALANCFSCKTPDFTVAVNELGDEAYMIPFEDMLSSVNNPISCYNCHANTPQDIVITHSYLTNAMGADFEKVDAATLACAQCHVEYYFAPDTKAVVLPYTGLGDMNPDDMLAYFNNLMVDGQPFADYVNPQSGVRQIKLQHPEFETYMGEGSVHANTFTCADCHMGVAVGADGSTYPNHNWVSPAENQALLDSSCAVCHADFEAFIRPIQKAVGDKTDKVGNLLLDLTQKLIDAVESGEYSEDELNAIRSLARDAQFYWDFVFVENSDGVHNSKLAHQCLDKAEQIANEAMAMFK